MDEEYYEDNHAASNEQLVHHEDELKGAVYNDHDVHVDHDEAELDLGLDGEVEGVDENVDVDEQAIPYDVANFMAINQGKIQELVDEIEECIYRFNYCFVNSNVATTRHEDGTLQILHYLDGGEENAIEMGKTSRSLRKFEELPVTIQKLQYLVDVYNSRDDFEDFLVGGDGYIVRIDSIRSLSVREYEDYAHLMAVWRAYAELYWITWQKPVKELEYGFVKPRKPFYSSELKELLVEFKNWFKQLEILSKYQFQGVTSLKTRATVGWRLRGCMDWKVFERAEAATGLDKKYHPSSFQVLFAEHFPRRQV